jgi:hypothetical protein
VLEYPYRRSLGPTLGRFFTALRDRRIEGIRSRTAGVIVPPQEYDPDTSEALDEFVEVGPAGAIVSWTWVATPRKKQPLGHPFAYALIRLDGADASMLHVVDAGDESRLATGARVKPRWALERGGGIRDIECFELEETE